MTVTRATVILLRLGGGITPDALSDLAASVNRRARDGNPVPVGGLAKGRVLSARVVADRVVADVELDGEGGPAADAPAPPPAGVRGEFLGHSNRDGFLYRYTCPRCRRTFLERAPDLSEPTLCHRCATGWRRGR